jgi:hypothetical protein
MVIISASSGTLLILVIQALTTLPSKITEQAPHSPFLHPTLVPVRNACFLKTSARDVSGSAIIVFFHPINN